MLHCESFLAQAAHEKVGDLWLVFDNQDADAHKRCSNCIRGGWQNKARSLHCHPLTRGFVYLPSFFSPFFSSLRIFPKGSSTTSTFFLSAVVNSTSYSA